MPRPRKAITDYTATTDVYRDFLRRGCELDQERSRVQREISAYNKAAESAGAHSGALSLARRLRRITHLDRRRLAVRECARVLVDLEDEIMAEEAAQLGHNKGPSMAEAEVRPFGSARSASAA